MHKLTVISILVSLACISCQQSNENISTKDNSSEIIFTSTINNEITKSIINDKYEKHELIYTKAIFQYDSGNLTSAKNYLYDIMLDFSNDLMRQNCESKLKIIDSQMMKNDEKIKVLKKEMEEKRNARLTSATKNLKKIYDEVEKISWYEDKSIKDRNSYVKLYIGSRNFDAWLRLKIKYYASDWIFANSIKIVADDEVFILDDISFDRDNSGGAIWEWCDIPARSKDIEMIKSIIKSKKTIVRFNGSKYYDDREVSEEQKKALQNILNAYAAF